MKKESIKKLFYLFFLLIGHHSLEGSLRADPNSLFLEGNYLYLRPISNYPFFAVNVDNNNTLVDKRYANAFSFNNGYRIEAGYTFCKCEFDMRGRWTHLNSTVQRELEVGKYIPAQLASFLPFTTFKIPNDKRTLDYEAFDLLWGYTFFRSASFLTLNLGLQWAKINFEETFSFPVYPFNPNPAQTFAAKGSIYSAMHGIGPEFGLLGKWQIPFACTSFLFLNGRVEGAFLFSTINSSFNTVQIVEFSNPYPLYQNISNDSKPSIIPAGAFSIGLSAEKSCYLHFLAEVGYTMIGYYQSLNFIGVSSSGGASLTELPNTLDLRDDIYFHGLYVTLGITY